MRWKLESSGLTKFNNTSRRPIITHHVAHSPKHINIRVLPPDIKLLVRSRFEDFHAWVTAEKYPSHVIASSLRIMNSILDYMNADDYHAQYWEYFATFTSKLDVIREQNILDVVTEFKGYL